MKKTDRVIPVIRLVAAGVRGSRLLDQHLTLIETARAVETGLPERGDLKPGSFSGEVSNQRWRVDVVPFRTVNVDPNLPTPWVPMAVVISVQTPAGSMLQVSTVRLRPRPKE